MAQASTKNDLQPVIEALRRSLIGAVALIDNLLGLPPTYPSKEERQLLTTIRKKRINIRAIRQFISQQLT